MKRGVASHPIHPLDQPLLEKPYRNVVGGHIRLAVEYQHVMTHALIITGYNNFDALNNMTTVSLKLQGNSYSP